MGHKFSLVLSREITDDESTALQEAGCGGAVFMAGSHPTDPAVPVTKLDFDDTVSPSLAEAIEAALEAVGAVPDLSVPSLWVPAQPANAAEGEIPAEGAGAAPATEAAAPAAPAQETGATAGETAVAKLSAKKSSSRKSAPRKSAAKKEAAPAAESVPGVVESDAASR